MIVGITGYKRSGKDTLAQAFVAAGWERYALADPIKAACSVIFDWTPAEIEDRKEITDPRWGISPRRAMQVIGTEVFRRALPDMIPEFVDKFWIQRMRWEYEKLYHAHMIVPDVRFEDEAQAIRELGGYIVRVERPGAQRRDPHPSETGVDDIKPDYTVLNEGNAADLVELGRKVVRTIEARG